MVRIHKFLIPALFVVLFTAAGAFAQTEETKTYHDTTDSAVASDTTNTGKDMSSDTSKSGYKNETKSDYGTESGTTTDTTNIDNGKFDRSEDSGSGSEKEPADTTGVSTSDVSIRPDYFVKRSLT